MDEPRAAWRTFGTPGSLDAGEDDAAGPGGPAGDGATAAAPRWEPGAAAARPPARPAPHVPEAGVGPLGSAPHLVPLVLAAATGAVLSAAIVLVLAAPGAGAVVVDAGASGGPGAGAAGGAASPGSGEAIPAAGGSGGDQATRGASAAGSSAAPGGEILVDVEGAVARPGIVRLAAGSRLGDAIAAAGGYAPTVDVPRAAARLNLAARVADGDRVHVPVTGEPEASAATAATETTGAAGDAAGGSTGASGGESTGGAVPAGSGSGGAAAGSRGPVNVNTASASELDTLPGIGPVTAQKIIDARAAAPFTSVADLRDRKVVSAATYAKIAALVTVGP